MGCQAWRARSEPETPAREMSSGICLLVHSAFSFFCPGLITHRDRNPGPRTPAGSLTRRPDPIPAAQRRHSRIHLRPEQLNEGVREFGVNGANAVPPGDSFSSLSLPRRSSMLLVINSSSFRSKWSEINALLILRQAGVRAVLGSNCCGTSSQPCFCDPIQLEKSASLKADSSPSTSSSFA